jgi:hypothetical protein
VSVERLNLFLNVMTPLIIVVSFSDSITFAAQDSLIVGADRRTAFFRSEPDCRAPHAFLRMEWRHYPSSRLQFSQSDLIQSFGARHCA